ncbi:hypothetical protein MBAV_004465 [Candidatus Magnetobacterium bavaricum]|uniref:Uncharacterized protein n=1 Tax=Candidatus Magnetobacterium bavaricum TaxID=29290 RepID=A0A0F3GN78_9BACT|nr:hypothetical protein MBAV_004465 [Candidatus Magnetobacterium bavaricum]
MRERERERESKKDATSPEFFTPCLKNIYNVPIKYTNITSEAFVKWAGEFSAINCILLKKQGNFYFTVKGMDSCFRRNDSYSRFPSLSFLA